MWSLAIAAGVLVGCSGSPEPEEPAETTEPPIGAVADDDPIDRDAAVERFVEVCGTLGLPPEVCVADVEPVVGRAVDAGCALASLEAYHEHRVTYGWDDEPHEAFFERCPRPLSVVMIGSGPDGFAEQGTTAYRTGAMRTDRVAQEFRDAESVLVWLDSLGHEMGYQQAWARGDDAVIVRLDRFASVEGARSFAEPAGATSEGGVERRTILGVEDGRLTTEVVEGADRPYQHLAQGRACDVAITVHALGSTEHIDVELVRDFFLDQARRAQVGVGC